MHDGYVYTVTVLDMCTDPVLGIRRTPAIYTSFPEAMYVVRNNVRNLSDGTLYQYAVIEETRLNVIRPQIDITQRIWWFHHNSADDEFVPCSPPRGFHSQSGFGIG